MEVKSELYAWITRVQGKDSLVGTLLLGAHTPLIATSRDLMERMRPVAIDHGEAFKQPVRLVRFTEVETLESHPAPQKNGRVPD